MTKIQKIWLGVFLSMFLVPEILWSPVINFVYELMQKGNTHVLRTNFLTSLQYNNLLLTVLFIELCGSLLSTLYFIRYSKLNKIFKIPLAFFLVVFLLVTLMVFYLAFSLRRGINF